MPYVSFRLPPLLSPSKKDANGGERGGYRRYRCKRGRVCVRRFHGNLSGVCLVPGDGEEREREERDERRGEKLSLVKGERGMGEEIMEGRR